MAEKTVDRRVDAARSILSRELKDSSLSLTNSAKPSASLPTTSGGSSKEK
jgi:hypothetical protein